MRRGFITAAFLACASGAFAQSSGNVSGSIVDQVGGLLPYVTVELTHGRSRAHHEARTDQIGHFEFEGLPAGEYLFEAKLSAFVPVEERVTLSTGEHLEQNVTMQLGPWEDRITVTGDDESRSSERDGGGVPGAPGGDACERSAVGGDVRPPARIREMRPKYSRQLRNDGVQGSVVVSGRIGADGRLEDSRVLAAAHPDLATAAMAAIAEWRWTLPRLDCVPVDAHITVTVDFRIQR